jgi:hypothetical protein
LARRLFSVARHSAFSLPSCSQRYSDGNNDPGLTRNSSLAEDAESLRDAVAVLLVGLRYLRSIGHPFGRHSAGKRWSPARETHRERAWLVHTDIGASIRDRRARARPPIQHESSRLAFNGSAMDVIDRAEQEPEPISIAGCRELLGDDADMMSDEEVLAVARHAESLAHVVIELAMRDVCVH